MSLDIDIRDSLRGIADHVPTLREFASTIRLVSGPDKGKMWSPESEPVQAWFIEQAQRKNPDGTDYWRSLSWCGAAQLGGKTLTGVLLPILYSVIALGEDVGYALPNGNDINKAWNTKLKKLITGAGFRKYLPDTGPGSKQGRGASLQFHDPDTGADLGSIIFVAGVAYGDTFRVLVTDEVDQFYTQGVPDWDDIGQIEARTGSYAGGGRRYRLGTCEHDEDETSIMLDSCDVEGTGHRLYAKCPYCEKYQPLTWERVNLERATYKCLHCPAEWTEPDRIHALHSGLFCARGQVIVGGILQGEEIDTGRRLGIVTGCLESTRSTMADRVSQFNEAVSKRDGIEATHEPLRRFYQRLLSRYYRGQLLLAGNLSREGIALRSAASDYQPGECPAWVEYLTCAVDVSKRVLWAMVMGHGQDKSAVIAWQSADVCGPTEIPDERARHAAFQRIQAWAMTGFAHVEGTKYPMLFCTDVRGGTESGEEGWQVDEAWHWVEHDPLNWWAVLGTGVQRGAPGKRQAGHNDTAIAPWLTLRVYEDGCQCMIIDTDQSQGGLQEALSREQKDGEWPPGSILLPLGIKSADSLAGHLVAERRVKTPMGKWIWDRTGQRCDWRDCTRYNIAMGVAIREIRKLQHSPKPRRVVGSYGAKP